jgi:CRP/FNR family transcriptional regulator, nitrogen oxide reductase regulator
LLHRKVSLRRTATFRPARRLQERLGVYTLDRSLIAGLPPFSGLSRNDLDPILDKARPIRVAAGKPVFEQDAEARSFFLLLDGHVRVLKTTAGGQQVIMRYISAGQMIGIATALGRKTYPATAIAAVDCMTLAWPNELWNEFSTRYPSFAANTYKAVSVRMEDAHERVVELATALVDRRVAHALVRLAEQTGRKTEHGVEIGFPITRQDIADMTGTTLHTVSRLLTAWEHQGFVRSTRKRVTVVDAGRLLDHIGRG